MTLCESTPHLIIKMVNIDDRLDIGELPHLMLNNVSTTHHKTLQYIKNYAMLRNPR